MKKMKRNGGIPRLISRKRMAFLLYVRESTELQRRWRMLCGLGWTGECSYS